MITEVRAALGSGAGSGICSVSVFCSETLSVVSFSGIFGKFAPGKALYLNSMVRPGHNKKNRDYPGL